MLRYHDEIHWDKEVEVEEVKLSFGYIYLISN
jgi:hypothetical protein